MISSQLLIVIGACFATVTGIEFTVSSDQVDPANPLQTIFWMNCTAASLTDVNFLFLIIIKRVSSSTDQWETIATVTAPGAAVPAETDLPNYWTSAQVSGSLYPVTGGDHPVTDSYLNVGVNASRLTCSDASMYRCELQYLSSVTQVVRSEIQNSSLTITASTTSHYATTTQRTPRPDAVFDVNCNDTSAGCNVQFDICHTPANTDWTKTNCRKSCGYCYSHVAPIVG